jgi:2-furoyl-CoA dehydrogenase large subunit
MLLDPETLRQVIPGAHRIERVSETRFRAEVTLGVGPVRGRYRAEVSLAGLRPPEALTLAGSADGALGFGRGTSAVRLEEQGDATVVHYRYEAEIGGKAAAVGGRLLDGAARLLIGQFFAGVAREADGGVTQEGVLARLLQWLRARR